MQQEQQKNNLREIFRRKLVQDAFARTMGLLGATTLGVGALMGAGIYVLIGLAAGKAGPGAWISYLICGVLSLLSVAMFGDLSRRVPLSGGGYAYAYKALGSFYAFMTGWLLALGSIMACAMYAMGLAFYLTSVFPAGFPEYGMTVIAVGAVAGLTVLNTLGAGGNKVQFVFTWGNLLILGVFIIAGLFKADTANISPMLPNGWSGVGEAVSLIYVSFFGYQLIANNAEEIVEPTKTVPRAMFLAMMVSLCFYVIIAIVSVLVVPWKELAESRAPLAVVAKAGMGQAGWIFIAAGGVLASAAALNSTIISQARQIFAMGRDRFLPSPLGRIHQTSSTPRASLLACGLATALAILPGELSFIVKAANFCFLVSLLPLSFALIRLHKTARESDPIGILKRIVPYAALAANVLLLLTLDKSSMIFGLQLAGIGSLLYCFYSRKREIRSRSGMSLILSEAPLPVLKFSNRILMPVANPRIQDAQFTLAQSFISKAGRTEVVGLSVVAASSQDFHTTMSSSEDSAGLLERSALSAEEHSIPFRPVVRVSRNINMGIVHAAVEESCGLIVMGFPRKQTSDSVAFVQSVLNRARADVVLLKTHGNFAPKKIAVSLTSHLNLPLMVKMAGGLADKFGGEITFLNIMPENYTRKQMNYSSKVLAAAISLHKGRALFRVEMECSDTPMDVLVDRSGYFDLLIIGAVKGANKAGLLKRTLVGYFASQIAARSKCCVAIARVEHPMKKLLFRFSDE
ncbi:amino acid permease [Desulfococcaceae bacterium HSG7]|nr:amino acid permease [Desulfococcaceae bacterium HSG7]